MGAREEKNWKVYHGNGKMCSPLLTHPVGLMFVTYKVWDVLSIGPSLDGSLISIINTYIRIGIEYKPLPPNGVYATREKVEMTVDGERKIYGVTNLGELAGSSWWQVSDAKMNRR